MKRSSNPAKEREIHKLKERLSIRERQFAVLVTRLKDIVSFETAPLSVFKTEVQTLQSMAIDALCSAEEIQRGKKGKILSRDEIRGQVLRRRRYLENLAVEGWNDD